MKPPLYLLFLFLGLQLGAQTNPVYITFQSQVLAIDTSINDSHQIPSQRILVLKDGQIIQKDYFQGLPSSGFTIIEGQQKWEYTATLNEKIVLSSKHEFPNQTILELSKDSKIIAGQSCDKVTLQEGESVQELFYSNTWALEYAPVAIVKGLALEYVQVFDDIGPVKFQAIDISEITPANFILPNISDYRAVEKATFVKGQEKIVDDRKEKIANAKKKMIGKKAKKFIVTTIDGKKYNSSKLTGKVIVINFWFVNCGPCRKEIPVLNELVADYTHREDVIFMGLALDPAHELPAFLAKIPFDYQIAGDALYLCDKFKVSNYPTNVVIDRKGVILAYHVGYTSNISDKLKAAIESAL